MQTFCITIEPLSPFGTPLKGDTLFGVLCWAVRNRYGEGRLKELLKDYTYNSPFLVVSDGFPAGYLPKPALPSGYFDERPDLDRKDAKKRVWAPVSELKNDVSLWLSACRRSDELEVRVCSELQPHNTIDRTSGTTNTDFAPFVMEQVWFGVRDETDRGKAIFFNIYGVVDEARMDLADLAQLVGFIGAYGFGRDASTGLGKFRVERCTPNPLPSHAHANAWLALAPCCLAGIDLDSRSTFYRVFTRFGRHGGAVFHRPFKTPVLLADTGAVLTPLAFEPRAFAGSGIGGDGLLSKEIPETVQQGYAPVVGIRLRQDSENKRHA